jgi:alpha-tubulin suppressor-like RCC1 family protein
MDGRMFVWGPVFADAVIQIPQELNTGDLVKTISIGEKITCYIEVTGKMYTWGTHNDQGQLGTKSMKNYPQLVSDLQHNQANDVSCGLDFCIALSQTVQRVDLTDKT